MSHPIRLSAFVLVAAACIANAATAADSTCVSKPDVLKGLSNELKSPDAMTRIATINAMLESCDPAQREIAYERGFASAEQTVRALALRGKLRMAKTLILEISPAVEGNKTAIAFIDRWGENIDLAVKGFVPETGQLTLVNYTSTVSGTQMSFNYGQCRGPLQLADGGVLKGKITCGGALMNAAIRL